LTTNSPIGHSYARVLDPPRRSIVGSVIVVIQLVKRKLASNIKLISS